MFKKRHALAVGPTKEIHTLPKKVGVVLINLGTPDSVSVLSVFRYLSRFLSDQRVIPLPSWLWKPLLNCVILPVRSFQSLERYKMIWSDEGSPLSVITRKQAEALHQRLSNQGFVVRHAMRYSSPSIADVVHTLLEKDKVSHLLFIPLYPQYASSTTGSTVEQITSVLNKLCYIPPFHILHHFHDHPEYIAALQKKVCLFFEAQKQPIDRLIISFHGLPRSSLAYGDPYHCFCQKTARLLMEGLPISSDRVDVCFQSRVGFAQWLGPYTKEHIEELARQGITRVAVVCPGFVADCLETLEEIQMELREAFLKAGGEHFDYIPCLNVDSSWIDALCFMTKQLSLSVFHANSQSGVLPSDELLDRFFNN